VTYQDTEHWLYQKFMGQGFDSLTRDEAIDLVNAMSQNKNDLQGEVAIARKARDLALEAIRIQKNAVKSLQLGFGNGYRVGLAESGAAPMIADLERRLKDEQEGRKDDNARFTEEIMRLEDAIATQTLRDEGRRGVGDAIR
jgi:hypothetical protein